MDSPWTADNGDGTYRNPVLNADWSDPDAVRVGDDFYLTASSFHRVPGLPVLHSRDLVNWTLIGHALTRLAPEEDFRTPQRGGGVWAPALRHHAGRFWIVYPDPDRGLFVTSAEDPAGEWTEPLLLKGGRGLIDPCPLWDEDGSAYLVHGWAKSRAGINNRLTVHRMSADATELLDEGVVVIDGDRLEGYRTLEGPKFYRRDGWYWIFAPAGGVTDGWQSAFRSRDPFGPYEDRIVLAQGSTPVNGPHQGAWVDTPDGADWFLHFQDKGFLGRVVHLQPLRWDEDGWPVIGDGGEPVLSHEKPVQGEPADAPAAGDDFATGIGLQWSWQANPEAGWVAAGGEGGDSGAAAGGRGAGAGAVAGTSGVGAGLRLNCVPGPQDLRYLPNLLGQLLPSDDLRAEVTVTLDGAAPGDRAGLAIVGDAYAWIGLERTENGTFLVHRTAEDGVEIDAAPPVEVTGSVTVAVEVEPGGRCRFAAAHGTGADGAPSAQTPGLAAGEASGLLSGGAAAAADIGQAVAAPSVGRAAAAARGPEHEPRPGMLTPVGDPFQAKEGRWVGAALGLFATGVAAHGTDASGAEVPAGLPGAAAAGGGAVHNSAVQDRAADGGAARDTGAAVTSGAAVFGPFIVEARPGDHG
ncbi:hypothetical protein GCM10009830_40650 [Glycomyces endophyticus]|uniref:Beta-xylosidase C-terminal Concanavalin A-like domain-containing protein n=1 Tax=Glycomyces endophyticus TaxID=480996 RepID=A0ABN2HJR1_9ACTN